MKTSIFKKRMASAMFLACISPVCLQSAQAAASFSSYATVSYTIQNIVNLTNAGDFSNLNVSGSLEVPSDQIWQSITGTGSVTPSASGLDNTILTPQVGSVFTKTFQLDGSASDGGTVDTRYLSLFSLAFNNISTSDNFAIDLNLSYQLHTLANVDNTGDSAATDVAVSYYNQDYSLFGNDYLAATDLLKNQDVSVALPSYGFTLAAGTQASIGVDTTITAKLQASSATVPVPSAVWLFGTGLAGWFFRSKSKSQMAL
jgi:hypothetical protein